MYVDWYKTKNIEMQKIVYTKVDDVVLNSVEKAKLLAVTIDKSLTCLEHIESLRQKACSKSRNFLDYKNGQLVLY